MSQDHTYQLFFYIFDVEKQRVAGAEHVCVAVHLWSASGVASVVPVSVVLFVKRVCFRSHMRIIRVTCKQ
jgi:hypothetical protein